MSKKSNYPGTEGRGTSIRIYFTFNGIPCRETIKLKDTPANRRYAFQERERIAEAIIKGTFDYAAEFPNSKTVASLGLQTKISQIKTFDDMAASYLSSNSHLSNGTLKNYRKELTSKWLPLFAGRPITTILHSEIAEKIGMIEWSSGKTRNNSLIPLRGIFEMAWIDGLIPNNPTARIKNQSHQKPAIDPFSKIEAWLIIEYMQENYKPAVSNYFQFALFTGMRPEELISLKWSDVDWRSNTIRVQRAHTSNETKSVKNNKIRDVDLNQVSLEALTKQKEVTSKGLIFINPVTGHQWNSNGKAQRMRYWTPTLAALGIRYRKIYNTRHTYATMLLMADTKPAYAAAQMGHSIIMFLNVYTKWIATDAQEAEKGKLDAFINGK